ncbi:hypothetical protein [Singulisphaera sp. GP187]|uniref:hypothetical protein n=1 Tax=Singulisphaera sp. GP187 TaxID=1882752 RepID=UPI0020B1232D|nr:hypothetical protein [Singulisphaera sp. GP187]
MKRPERNAGLSWLSSYGKRWWDGFSLVFTTMCAFAVVLLPFRLWDHLEKQYGADF